MMYNNYKLTLADRNAFSFIFDIADYAKCFVEDETGMVIQFDRKSYEISEHGITVSGTGFSCTGLTEMDVLINITHGGTIIKLIVWNGNKFNDKNENRYEFKWIRHKLRKEILKTYAEDTDHYYTVYRANYDETGKMVKLLK